MTEPRTTGKTDPAAEAIAAAIGQLTGDGGGATPADIAAAAGVAYSTTNKKLRALREAGRAESFDSDDKRTLWRLTTASPASTATEPEAAPATPDEGDPGAATPPATVAEPAEQAGAKEAGDEETGVEEPDDGTAAAAAAAAMPAAATATDSAEQPDGTGPDETPADPPDTDTADGAAGEAGEAEAGGAAKPATPSDTPAAAGDDGQAPATTRRPGGSLRGAILDILEANPDGQYKVGQLCKLIDKASEGTGYVNVGAGAVYNAVVKLVGEHRAVQTVDKPATFQLAPPAAD